MHISIKIVMQDLGQSGFSSNKLNLHNQIIMKQLNNASLLCSIMSKLDVGEELNKQYAFVLILKICML